MAVIPTQPLFQAPVEDRSDIGLAFEKGVTGLTGTGSQLLRGFSGTFARELGLEEMGANWIGDAYARGLLMSMDIEEIDKQMTGPRTIRDVEDWKGAIAWGVNSVAEQVPTLMGQYVPAVAVGLLTRNPALTTATALGTIGFMNTAEVYSNLLLEAGESRPALAVGTGAVMSSLDALLPMKVMGRMGLGTSFAGFFGKKLKTDKKLRASIAGALEGGALEGTTEYIQTIFENLALQHVKGLDKLPEFTEEMMLEQEEAGARGALLGALMGGGSSYIGAVRRGRELKRLAQQKIEKERAQTEQLATLDSHEFLSPLSVALDTKINISESEQARARMETDYYAQEYPGGQVPLRVPSVQMPGQPALGLPSDVVNQEWFKSENYKRSLYESLLNSEMSAVLSDADQTLYDQLSKVEAEKVRAVMGQTGVPRVSSVVPYDQTPMQVTTDQIPDLPDGTSVTVEIEGEDGKPVRVTGTVETITTESGTTGQFIQVPMSETRGPAYTTGTDKIFLSVNGEVSGNILNVSASQRPVRPPIQPTQRPEPRMDYEGAVPLAVDRSTPVTVPTQEWRDIDYATQTKKEEGGWVVVGKMAMTNLDDSPAMSKGSQRHTDIKQNSSWGVTLKKETSYAGSDWVVINDETGEITDRNRLVSRLEKKYAGSPAGIDPYVAPQKAKEVQETELLGEDYERWLVETGALDVKRGHRVRIQTKDSEGKWTNIDPSNPKLQEFEPVTLTHDPKVGKFGGPEGSVLYQFKFDDGRTSQTVLEPEDADVARFVLVQSGARKLGDTAERVTTADLAYLDELLTEDQLAEIFGYTTKGEPIREAKEKRANTEKFIEYIQNPDNVKRLGDALAIAEKDGEDVVTNVKKLSKLTEAQIEDYISGMERVKDRKPTQEQVDKEEVDVAERTRQLEEAAFAKVEGDLTAEQEEEIVDRVAAQVDQEIADRQTAQEKGETKRAKSAREKIKYRRDKPETLTGRRVSRDDELPKGAALFDVIDKVTLRLPSPETHEVKIKPEVAKERGLNPQFFYTFSEEWLRPQQYKNYISIQGNSIKKTDIVDIREIEGRAKAPKRELSGEEIADIEKNIARLQAQRKKLLALSSSEFKAQIKELQDQYDEAVISGGTLPGGQSWGLAGSPYGGWAKVERTKYIKKLRKLSLSEKGKVYKQLAKAAEDEINELNKLAEEPSGFIRGQSRENKTRYRTGEYRGMERIAELPEGIPNPETVREFWIDNKSGILIVQREATIELKDLDKMDVDYPYDYEVYVTWYDREEHKIKLEQTRDRLLEIHKKTEGRFRWQADVVDLRDNKEFLGINFDDSTRGAEVTVQLTPSMIRTINRERKEAGLSTLPFTTKFDISAYYVETGEGPLAMHDVEQLQKIRENKGLPPIDVLKTGTAGPEYVSPLKGPSKNKIMITLGSYSRPINVTSATKAFVERSIPERVGVMLPYESLVAQGPARGVRLIGSFKGSISSEVSELEQLMADMFVPKTHAFGPFGVRSEEALNSRAAKLEKAKGKKIQVEFFDGTILEGTIGKVRKSAGTVEIITSKKEWKRDLPVEIDILGFDRVQIEEPLADIKIYTAKEGPTDPLDLPVDDVIYVPLVGGRVPLTSRTYASPEPEATLEVPEGVTKVEVYRVSQRGKAPSSQKEARYRIVVDGTQEANSAGGEVFGIVQAVQHLNRLVKEVGAREGLDVITMPSEIESKITSWAVEGVSKPRITSFKRGEGVEVKPGEITLGWVAPDERVDETATPSQDVKDAERIQMIADAVLKVTTAKAATDTATETEVETDTETEVTPSKRQAAYDKWREKARAKVEKNNPALEWIEQEGDSALGVDLEADVITKQTFTHPDTGEQIPVARVEYIRERGFVANVWVLNKDGTVEETQGVAEKGLAKLKETVQRTVIDDLIPAPPKTYENLAPIREEKIVSSDAQLAETTTVSEGRGLLSEQVQDEAIGPEVTDQQVEEFDELTQDAFNILDKEGEITQAEIKKIQSDFKKFGLKPPTAAQIREREVDLTPVKPATNTVPEPATATTQDASVNKDKPLGEIGENQKFTDYLKSEWQVVEHLGNRQTVLRWIGGEKPQTKLRVTYNGKKETKEWEPGMLVIADSLKPHTDLYIKWHSKAGRLTLATVKGKTESIPNFSVVRPIVGDGTGSITINTGLIPSKFRDIVGKRIGRRVLDKLESDGVVRIVQNQQDVPNPPRDLGIKAMERNGQVWFVTNNIEEGEVAGVFAHEVGVHVGLLRVFGEKVFRQVMDLANSLKDSNDQWIAAFKTATQVYDALHKAPDMLDAQARAEWNDMTQEQADAFITEEAIGYYTEAVDPTNDTFWQRVVDLLRRSWARVKPYLGLRINEADMMAFIRGAIRGNMNRNVERAQNRMSEHYSEVFGLDLDRKAFEKIAGAVDKVQNAQVQSRVSYFNDIRKKVVKFFEPMRYLPYAGWYKQMRSIAQGRMAEYQQLGKEVLNMYDNLSEQDTEELLAFFKTKDADENNISNPKLREASVRYKALIRSIGEEAVARDLIAPDQMEQYKELHDAYLPRIFLLHLLSSRSATSLPSGMKRSHLHWTKERIEMEQEQIDLLKEVRDVNYLVYRAITIPMTDMILTEFLENVSQQAVFNKGEAPWVMPNQFISVDGRRRTVSSVRRQHELYKMMADKETNAEAKIKYQDKAAELEKHVKDFYEKQGLTFAGSKADQESALEAYYSETYDIKQYKKIPDDQRFGAMRGLWVRKEIYDDIRGNASQFFGDEGMMGKIFSPHGAHAHWVQIFKTMKVPLNPPAVIRNAISNTMLLQLGGMPFHQQPRYFRMVLDMMKGKGDQHQKFDVPVQERDKNGIPTGKVVIKKMNGHEIAQHYGISMTTMRSAEMNALETVITSMEKDGVYGSLYKAKKAWAKLAEAGGNMYQTLEMLGKTASIQYKMENKQGELSEIANENKGPDGEPLSLAYAAVFDANQTLFDYSEVSPAVRGLRSSFFGAPFITFQVKVLPLLMRTMARHPMRFLPYVAMYAGAQAAFGSIPFSDDEWDKYIALMPDFIKESGHGMLMPWKDEHDRVLAFDVSWMVPWGGMWGSMGDLLRGEPVKAMQSIGLIAPGWQVANAVLTNKDYFTNQAIRDETGSVTDQAFDVFNYAWQMSMPPWLSNRGFIGGSSMIEAAARLDPTMVEGKIVDAVMGRTNRYGEPDEDALTSILYLAGLNLRPIAKNARSLKMNRMMKSERDLFAGITSTRKDKSMSKSQKSNAIEEFRKRIDEARKERREFARASV